MDMIRCYRQDWRVTNKSSERMICGLPKFENATGPCGGDSGGPLMIETSLGWKLIGIVSVGMINKAGECEVLSGALYTDVSKFIDWIQNITQEFDMNIIIEEKTVKTLSTEESYSEDTFLNAFKMFLTQPRLIIIVIVLMLIASAITYMISKRRNSQYFKNICNSNYSNTERLLTSRDTKISHNNPSLVWNGE